MDEKKKKQNKTFCTLLDEKKLANCIFFVVCAAILSINWLLFCTAISFFSPLPYLRPQGLLYSLVISPQFPSTIRDSIITIFLVCFSLLSLYYVVYVELPPAGDCLLIQLGHR
jgi:hypothetical protein